MDHTVTVAARAALAGNPSDGYGGAVLAVPVPGLAATARLTTTSTPAGDSNAGSVGGSEMPLVAATRRRFEIDFGRATGEASVEITTTIPQSVGLAGSSAIITATIRVLDAWAGTNMADADVAAMCHRVERTDLGIAGGWQDQIMQAHATTRPLLMEFGDPMHHEAIDAAPIPLFIAYSAAAAESSSVVHSDLRSRASEIGVVAAELAAWARSGAAALANGETHQLKEAINASFDLRETIQPINPSHKQMITVARAAGAACNFAGSGGAIVGVIPKDPQAFATAIAAANLELIAL